MIESLYLLYATNKHHRGIFKQAKVRALNITLPVVQERMYSRMLTPKNSYQLQSFVIYQGMLELFEDKVEEIRSGKNKYFTMLEVVRKLKGFVDTKKQPAGLDLAKMFGNILLKRSFDSVGSWHVKGLFLGMMHFQDKYNEDLERLQRCKACDVIYTILHLIFVSYRFAPLTSYPNGTAIVFRKNIQLP